MIGINVFKLLCKIWCNGFKVPAMVLFLFSDIFAGKAIREKLKFPEKTLKKARQVRRVVLVVL